MNKDEMFSQLVENAFDFLFKAVSEIEDQPKYSVINFYAAVELFVKARLMKEHWSLVISQRQEAGWDKFIAGDFQSVTLNEAAKKLKNVVRSGLTKAELNAFQEVANDRNKMVHFFHDAQSEEEVGDFKRTIAKKQLKAWFFLHQLFQDKWRDEFSPWNEKISELDEKLRRLHDFLQVIFDSLKPKIEKSKVGGALYDDCPSCGFESQELCDDKNSPYEAQCLVCGLVEKCLNIECPKCDTRITLKDGSYDKCPSCQKTLEPSDIAGALVDGAAAYVAAKEGDHYWGVGNCSECDGYHSVVRAANDEWVCTSCFLVFESVHNCEWCNEPNTGDMEHSYVAGCSQCEGMAGWRKDD